MNAKFKQKLQNKEAVFGFFLKSCDADNMEIMASLGYDFCVIDAEHAGFAPREISHLLRTAQLFDLPCIVRTPGLNPGFNLSVLDSGACGIQVPNVDTKEQAIEVINSAFYLPKGARGFAPSTRAAGFGLKYKPAEYAKLANDTVIAAIHCETKRSVENLDEILQQDLDVVFIGPMDLSQSYGHLGQLDVPVVKEALEGSIKKIHASGKTAGFLCAPDKVDYYYDLGVRYFLLGADQGFMASAGKGALDKAKTALKG